MTTRNFSDMAVKLVERAGEEDEGHSFGDLLRALVYAVLAVAERLRRIEDVACSVDDLREEMAAR